MKDFDTIHDMLKELDRAMEKYSPTFHSDNEAWGTIDMESQEAREAIHARDYQSAYDECIQVAAMGIKAAMYFKDKKK
jgi:hypothetical protein